ncbi:hypothetical protein C8R44DRAFT_755081 [Mycena epipterygia]|nr:hypothetical protein C8R44DRAFT_755081 [Mycena epipterygia]
MAYHVVVHSNRPAATSATRRARLKDAPKVDLSALYAVKSSSLASPRVPLHHRLPLQFHTSHTPASYAAACPSPPPPTATHLVVLPASYAASRRVYYWRSLRVPSSFDLWGKPMPLWDQSPLLDLAQCDESALRAIWPPTEDFDEDMRYISTIKTYHCLKVRVASRFVPALTEFREYPLIWDRILAAQGHVSCTLIFGGPGIGKSCSLTYILFRALSEKRTVVTCFDGRAVLFCETGIYTHTFSDKIVSEEERNFWGLQLKSSWTGPRIEPHTWVLLDASEDDPSPPHPFFTTLDGQENQWFQIYASSPADKRLRWLIRKPHLSFTMQPPSWKELVAAIRYPVFSSGLTHPRSITELEALRERHYKLGPRARILFQSALSPSSQRETYVTEVASTIKEWADGAGWQRLKSDITTTPTLYSNAVSHKLFLILRGPEPEPLGADGKLDMYHPSWAVAKLVIASEPIMKDMLDAVTKQDLLTLLESLEIPAPSHFLGSIWQWISVSVLSNGFGPVPGLTLLSMKEELYSSTNKDFRGGGRGTSKIQFTRFYIGASKTKESKARGKKRKRENEEDAPNGEDASPAVKKVKDRTSESSLQSEGGFSPASPLENEVTESLPQSQGGPSLQGEDFNLQGCASPLEISQSQEGSSLQGELAHQTAASSLSLHESAASTGPPFARTEFAHSHCRFSGIPPIPEPDVLYEPSERFHPLFDAYALLDGRPWVFQASQAERGHSAAVMKGLVKACEIFGGQGGSLETKGVFVLVGRKSKPTDLYVLPDEVALFKKNFAVCYLEVDPATLQGCAKKIGGPSSV